MSPIQTLSDRKRARVDMIRAALPALEEALARYARDHGGSYVLYGSAVTGALHFESDVDLLSDFPADKTAQALEFAEDLASRLGLTLDAQPRVWCKQDFLDRLAESCRVLP